MDPTADRVGTLLGKYHIEAVLGKGGMGVVYRAVDTMTDRRVALKELPAHVAGNSGSLRRFLREAKAAARIEHPNVVGIYDVDQRDGVHYIAMQLVTGGSALDAIALRGPFLWPEAAAIVMESCRGLEAAHRAGLIHRDIKPANILRSDDGTVKIADFGLAKAGDIEDDGLTREGDVVGTPLYMSPEQCLGEELDHRCDLYALGCTAYALMAGRPPYVRKTSQQIMFAHVHEPVPDIRDVHPEVPEQVSAVIRRAMSKRRDERFDSAAEMADAMQAAMLASGTVAALSPGDWSGRIAGVTDAVPQLDVEIAPDSDGSGGGKGSRGGAPGGGSAPGEVPGGASESGVEGLPLATAASDADVPALPSAGRTTGSGAGAAGKGLARPSGRSTSPGRGSQAAAPPRRPSVSHTVILDEPGVPDAAGADSARAGLGAWMGTVLVASGLVVAASIFVIVKVAGRPDPAPTTDTGKDTSADARDAGKVAADDARKTPPDTGTTPPPKDDLKAKTPAKADPDPPPAPAKLVNSIGMRLVPVPAGTLPRAGRTIRLTKPFHIGAFEVTQAQYRRVMGRLPSEFAPGGRRAESVAGIDTADFPADHVTWHDAVDFCRRLSELPDEHSAGRSYRLPTEAEWEYACRAGTTTEYSFGDSLAGTEANYRGAREGPKFDRPCRAGSFPPNAWGLYDMHGNLVEWTADWHDPDWFVKCPEVDPPGPPSSAKGRRIVRGGNWAYGAELCRSSKRGDLEPDYTDNTVGFRVVMVPAELPASGGKK